MYCMSVYICVCVYVCVCMCVCVCVCVCVCDEYDKGGENFIREVGG